MSLLSVSDLATIDRFVQTRRDRADLAGGLPGLFNGRRVGRGGHMRPVPNPVPNCTVSGELCPVFTGRQSAQK